MSEKEKLRLLGEIAPAFNAAGFLWALGASGFLYLKGLVPTFHDLDLLVGEKDGPQAEALLRKMGEELSARQDKGPY
jgi:hypothetical protein